MLFPGWCPCDIHAELSINGKYTNGYPCVYAISMNRGCPFGHLNGFPGMDISMDIAWILQLGL